MKTHSPFPAEVNRVLIRGTNWAGDTIISLPAAREMRRVFSHARITFWVPDNIAPLVLAAGVCDDVIGISYDRRGLFVRPFRTAKQLAKRRFDMVVLLQNAFESAFTSWLAGIPLRAGYPTDLRGPLLNLKIPFPPGIRNNHQAFYYLGIAEFVESVCAGSEPKKIASPDCRIFFPPHNIEAASRLVSSLGGNADYQWFCLCPGSANSEAKRWLPDYFAALADMLADQQGAQIIFCGSPSEALLIEQIVSMQRTQGALNLAGKTDMLGMMSVMSRSRMVVSNDTGSAHLAASAGATVLTLFGPTLPGATAPLGSRSYTVQGTAPCNPCKHFRCPKPDHPCMRNLTPSIVLERIEAILSQEH